MASPKPPNLAKKMGCVANLWFATFAISSGLAGAGVALWVIPQSAKGWADMDVGLPSLTQLILSNHVALGVGSMVASVLACGVLLIRPWNPVLKHGICALLTLFPATIAVAGILAWWLAYRAMLDSLMGS